MLGVTLLLLSTCLKLFTKFDFKKLFLLVIITQTSLAQEDNLLFRLSNKPLLQTTYDCGGKGEKPCGIDTTFFWENGTYFCDQGLRPTDNTLKELYFLERGEFLKALAVLKMEQLLDPEGICVNYSRCQDTVDDFQKTWQYWVAQEQLHLVRHDPINTAMLLATHNAYNNAADSYFPNQNYSIITDHLRIGMRVIMLNVHYSYSSFWTGSVTSLCHGLRTHARALTTCFLVQ